ncbi:DUF2570 domain-containing protein, partial [Salmonella enterica]|uniref:DUF2570 domain-containing protein n=1 Tax=Salmonella enterica TaxID=28901 RepID=UPI00398C467D
MGMSMVEILLSCMCVWAVGLLWTGNNVYGKLMEERERADAEEQLADSTKAITENVLRTMAITNLIQEANQHAKQQIALESQRTQEDNNVAGADDDCSPRPVPDGAPDRVLTDRERKRYGAKGALTCHAAR